MKLESLFSRLVAGVLVLSVIPAPAPMTRCSVADASSSFDAIVIQHALSAPVLAMPALVRGLLSRRTTSFARIQPAAAFVNASAPESFGAGLTVSPAMMWWVHFLYNYASLELGVELVGQREYRRHAAIWTENTLALVVGVVTAHFLSSLGVPWDVYSIAAAVTAIFFVGGHLMDRYVAPPLFDTERRVLSALLVVTPPVALLAAMGISGWSLLGAVGLFYGAHYTVNWASFVQGMFRLVFGDRRLKWLGNRFPSPLGVHVGENVYVLWDSVMELVAPGPGLGGLILPVHIQRDVVVYERFLSVLRESDPSIAAALTKLPNGGSDLFHEVIRGPGNILLRWSRSHSALDIVEDLAAHKFMLILASLEPGNIYERTFHEIAEKHPKFCDYFRQRLVEIGRPDLITSPDLWLIYWTQTAQPDPDDPGEGKHPKKARPERHYPPKNRLYWSDAVFSLGVMTSIKFTMIWEYDITRSIVFANHFAQAVERVVAGFRIGKPPEPPSESPPWPRSGPWKPKWLMRQALAAA